MDFDKYEKLASRTGVFEGKVAENPLMYLGLGVTSEAGEVADKIKKIMRNDQGIISPEKKEALKLELGDVLWYLSQISKNLSIPFSEVAQANIDKLWKRHQEGLIKGSGDNR